MSNDSFKVKKSLTLTPARMVDIINPQAGDLACDIDDNNKIKRYNDQKLSWEEIGSGGQDSSQLLDNGGFEEVERSWTLTAGVSSINPDPVVGDYCLEVSLADEALELFQDSTLNQTALSDGVQGLAYIRVKTALSGIKVCFRQAGVTSTNLCVDVNNNNKWGLYKLPVILGGTSNGIAVTSEGVVKTGTVIVDDAFVGAQDVKQDAVKIESQSVIFFQASSPNNLNLVTAANKEVGGGLFTAGTSSGTITALKDLTVTYTVNGYDASSSDFTVNVLVSDSGGLNTCGRARPRTGAEMGTAACTAEVKKGGTVYLTQSGTWGNPQLLGSIHATSIENTSIYSTASDSFSTDTNTLTHKPSVAITAADPIGTFNTYSYAANSNTRTICTAAPSTLPTKADGFRIFTRAYNAASTCGNPSRIELKIAQPGTSLPTLTRDIYKDTGKSVSGSLDLHFSSSGAARFGLYYDSYEESSGVLTLDAATAPSTITSATFNFSDISSQTSGYLVINAQKMKDAIVGDFAALNYVYVEAAGNAGQTITTNVTDIPFIEITDTHNAWDGSTFTVPMDGVYSFHTCVAFTSVAERSNVLLVNSNTNKRINPDTNTSNPCGSTSLSLTSGDLVKFRMFTNGGTLNNTALSHYLTITRIPGQF
jgi:hypothetical protein